MRLDVYENKGLIVSIGQAEQLIPFFNDLCGTAKKFHKGIAGIMDCDPESPGSYFRLLDSEECIQIQKSWKYSHSCDM